MTAWEKRLTLLLLSGTLLLATNAWLVMSGQWPADDRLVQSQGPGDADSPAVDTRRNG